MANFFSLNCRLSTIASSCVRHFLFNLKILLVIFHNKKINLAAVGWGINYEKRRQLRSLNYRHCGALSPAFSSFYYNFSCEIKFLSFQHRFLLSSDEYRVVLKIFSLSHFFYIFFSQFFLFYGSATRHPPNTHTMSTDAIKKSLEQFFFCTIHCWSTHILLGYMLCSHAVYMN